MSRETTLKEEVVIGKILRRILFSNNFKLSGRKRAEIVNNLFTLQELKELPKPYGEAYYHALESIKPMIEVRKKY